MRAKVGDRVRITGLSDKSPGFFTCSIPATGTVLEELSSGEILVDLDADCHMEDDLEPRQRVYDGEYEIIPPWTEPVPDIEYLRSSLAHGMGVTQAQLDDVIKALAAERVSLRPEDKDELLPLYDNVGNPLGTMAPRWLCHVLDLRHCCAHVLLVWRSPKTGEALILQIRNWNKDDSPGCLDISAGGHMTAADPSAGAAALKELSQETGLSSDDLESLPKPVGGYAFEEARPGENFFNSEWRDVYVATVQQDRFGSIRFPDEEVAGIVLLPSKDAGKLLAQAIVPMASALKKSLPLCLGVLGS